MAKHSFPAAEYDDPLTGCTLIPVNNALIPLLEGMMRDMLRLSYWQTESDYERGYNAISEVITDMANNCMQALLDSNLQMISLLQQIAINTGLSSMNSGNAFNYALRNLCCDLALPEPLADIAERPDDDYMCRGLQLMADALASTADDLWRYASETRYADATGVALVVNRSFGRWSLPAISQQTASELAGAIQELGIGFGSPGDYLTPTQKMTMVMAIYDAGDPQQARNSYIAWAGGLAGAPAEVQHFFAVLGRDQALWNGLFAMHYTATDYDGSLCGAEPPEPPTEFTLYSSWGRIVNTDTMITRENSNHHYLRIDGSYTAYLGSYNIDDNTRMYQESTYLGSLHNPPAFSFFTTDWGGVQLRIASGPSDVSIIFWNESAPIELSNSAYTTLPAGTTRFMVYSPSAGIGVFTLLAIFP